MKIANDGTVQPYIVGTLAFVFDTRHAPQQDALLRLVQAAVERNAIFGGAPPKVVFDAGFGGIDTVERLASHGVQSIGACGAASTLVKIIDIKDIPMDVLRRLVGRRVCGRWWGTRTRDPSCRVF